jgi:hypothetical protein
MLINKGFNSGDVISLKLINGEELIARFDEESSETIKILKPLCVTLNGQGLGMMPWMFLGNSADVTIKKSHVFAMMASKRDAADQYRQNTTDIALK